MRLNPFDTSKIKVRGGGSGGRSKARRAGGVGIVGIVIAIIGALAFGINPATTLGVLGGLEGAAQSDESTAARELSEDQLCSSGPYAAESCSALQSLNETWEPVFARADIRFEQPELVLYPPGPIRTKGCGSTTSASGPFYCPADFGIYIETGFFDQLAQMSGTRGDFARLYVMAHEYAHHIQNLTGTMAEVRRIQQRRPQEASQWTVRLELQADCYAGVWAGKNRARIDPGDLEEGLMAAGAVGDDTIQRRQGRRINPESFTHGTSQQRIEALRRGFNSGDNNACDAYFE